MIDTLITARNVGCIYSDKISEKTEAKALSTKGIFVDSLAIPRVGITVITGKSGSGKSTLLGLLSRIREENAQSKNPLLKLHRKNGDVSLLKNEDIKGTMGFVFQEPHLIKNITVEANAELAFKAIGKSVSGSQIKELAKLFEIDHLWYEPASTLSGGQAQRLSVLRALAVDPEILICDEPTSSLDDETANSLLKILSNWAKNHNKAILWVTHNLSQAAEYSDYLVKVVDGRVKIATNGLPYDLRRLSIEEKADILSDKAIAEEINSSETILQTGKSEKEKRNKKDFNLNLSTFCSFVFKLSYLDIYFSNRRITSSQSNSESFGDSSPTGSGSSEAYWSSNKQSFFQKVLAPFRKSLSWVYLLGLVVISLLSICWFTGQTYFKEKLNSPEVTHFTLTSYSDLRLDYRTLQSFNKHVQNLTESKKAAVFGRREFPLQNVYWPKNDRCKRPSKRDFIGIPILVYQENEPLFLKSFKNLQQSSRTLFVTKDVFAKLPQVDEQNQKNSKICVEIFGKYKAFEVVETTNNVIPGSLDQTYFAAMSDETYRRLAAEIDGQRFQNTAFQRLAIYFSKSTNKKILCSFGAISENQCENSPLKEYSSLKINKDVFKQLGSLTLISTTANIVFIALLISFLCVLSISISLAVSDYIRSNQKSLAVLKAFGASRLFLTSLIFTNSVILKANAALVLVALYFLLIASYNHYGGALIQINEFLDLSIKNILISVGIMFFLSSAMIIAIVLNWIRKNEYVAETLQQV